MKKVILLAFTIMLTSQTFAQITLEHTYEGFDNLKLIKLEVDGYKYVICGKVYKQEGTSYSIYDSTIYIYNLDHTIFKTIKSFYHNGRGLPNPILITQNLFNLDSKIEILFTEYDSYNSKYFRTTVLDEDGKKIFEDTSGYIPANGFSSYDTGLDYDISKNIFNTNSGSKMILYSPNSVGKTVDFKTKVYSLPGRLSLTAIDINDNKRKNDLSPFPNPSNNIINIPYQLNSNAIASVTITDMMGKIVKTYKVDNTFNSLLVNLDDFKSGTYVYTIQKENDLISQGKFIVSK